MAINVGGTDIGNADHVQVPSSDSDPTSPGAGDVYYNSTDNKLKVYDSTDWVDIVL